MNTDNKGLATFLDLYADRSKEQLQKMYDNIPQNMSLMDMNKAEAICILLMEKRNERRFAC